jgi:hypothetical protein
VDAIVNYDRFSIVPELIDDYTAMVKGIMDRHYSDVTRYTSSTFLRADWANLRQARRRPAHLRNTTEAQQRLKPAWRLTRRPALGAALDFLDEALHAGGGCCRRCLHRYRCAWPGDRRD